MRTLRYALAACATVAATATVALAAAPVAVTGNATDVSATTATVHGTVSPSGEDTTYFFQYGTTSLYGSQTPVEGPLKGNAKDRDVRATLSGLAPSTTYHYRLVATNATGRSEGQDRTFTTSGEPLSISADPRTVTFGRSTSVTGTLAGPDNANRTIILESNPAPFTGGFKPTGQVTVTNAAGQYAFDVTPSVNTRYRVSTTGKGPDRTSSELLVRVRVKVALRVSDRTPSPGERVRFAGTVLPGHDGKVARIQRRTASGSWRTVAQAPLVAASPVGTTPRSKFAKRVRVNTTGVYRVRVAPGDGDHIAGNSRRRTLTVG